MRRTLGADRGLAARFRSALAGCISGRLDCSAAGARTRTGTRARSARALLPNAFGTVVSAARGKVRSDAAHHTEPQRSPLRPSRLGRATLVPLSEANLFDQY